MIGHFVWGNAPLKWAAILWVLNLISAVALMIVLKAFFLHKVGSISDKS